MIHSVGLKFPWFAVKHASIYVHVIPIWWVAHCHEGMLGCSPKMPVDQQEDVTFSIGAIATWMWSGGIIGYSESWRGGRRTYKKQGRSRGFFLDRPKISVSLKENRCGFFEVHNDQQDVTVLTVDVHSWLPIQWVLTTFNLKLLCIEHVIQVNTSNGSQHAATNKGSCCHKGRQFSRGNSLVMWSSHFPRRGLGKPPWFSAWETRRFQREGWWKVFSCGQKLKGQIMLMSSWSCFVSKIYILWFCFDYEVYHHLRIDIII